MELSEYFHRNYLQAFQARNQQWRSETPAVSIRSNTCSLKHDPAELWFSSASDSSMTNNFQHQGNVVSKCINNTSINGNCVFGASCKNTQVIKNSVLRSLLLRCLPTARCSSQKITMDSVSYSSSVVEGLEEERLPGVLQKSALGHNHNSQISEQELSQWLEKETGMDRLRMMYSLGPDGAFIHADTRNLNTMWYRTVGLGAGLIFAVSFLEQYSEKQKKLSNVQPLLREGVKQQVNWKKIMAVSAKNTLRITVASALLLHLSQAIAAYRNKSSVWEYAISATLACGVMGRSLKHCAKLSLRGAALGIVGGYVVCKCLSNDGVNQEQKHLEWIRHHWHEKKLLEQTYE